MQWKSHNPRLQLHILLLVVEKYIGHLGVCCVDLYRRTTCCLLCRSVSLCKHGADVWMTHCGGILCWLLWAKSDVSAAYRCKLQSTRILFKVCSPCVCLSDRHCLCVWQTPPMSGRFKSDIFAASLSFCRPLFRAHHVMPSVPWPLL